IDPIVNFFEYRFKIGRGWAVLLTLLLALGVLGLAIFFLAANLIIEIQLLALTLPAQVQRLGVILQDYFYGLQNLYIDGSLPLDVSRNLQSLLDNSIVALKDAFSVIAQSLLAFIGSLPQLFISLIIIFMGTYFFSRDKEMIYDSLLQIVPAPWRERLSEVLDTLGRAVIRFLRAEILLISLQMTQSIIGLLLLKVDFALTLAVLIGLADLLPVVGPGTVFIPWVIIEFILGNYGLGFALLVLYAFIIILRQVLQPKLVAASLGLYPLTTLVALFAGLRLFGVWGLILGPLLLVILKAILRSGREVKQ
ncbi:MAG: sporulation integral membrane protein YtvI, partial [Clostridia bacterium]|nr:sporulation integral membrane protein YtvI [Clostridia bacterium]